MSAECPTATGKLGFKSLLLILSISSLSVIVAMGLLGGQVWMPIVKRVWQLFHGFLSVSTVL